MDEIKKVKSISIWVFIVPFVAINTCLILITQFHALFPNQEHIVHNSLWPYIDGGLSISRAARPYPSWLIFKPAMFLTSFLLIKYWYFNRDIIGIEFDNNLYKLFRRVIMLVFIIFEITAQSYLVYALYSVKEKLSKFINIKVLKLKLVLVSTLIVVAVIAIPIISWPGNTFKFVKHALEWDYFLGVITFYLLTYFMWKKS